MKTEKERRGDSFYDAAGMVVVASGAAAVAVEGSGKRTKMM